MSVVVSEIVQDAAHQPWSTMLAHVEQSGSSTPGYSSSPHATHSSRPCSQRSPAVSTPSHVRGQSSHSDETPHAQEPISCVPPQPPSPKLAATENVHQTSQETAARADGHSSSSSEAQSPQSLHHSQSLGGSTMNSPPCIKVRDLQHIQSFASIDMLTESASDTSLPARRQGDPPPQYEISEMPVGDVIEMVAGLLTKIITTNDRQHEHLHRQIPSPDAAAGLSSQTSSVLAFHGKNVPGITIMSYLSRIQKYCPAKYDVFLSLLVYFDRITERVNSGPMQNLRLASQGSSEQSTPQHGLTPPISPSRSSQAPLMNRSSQGWYGASADRRRRDGTDSSTSQIPQSPSQQELDPYNLAHFFVVDSFNIHRLVIAGVTVASKFFSDIFYTNSRYAKVSDIALSQCKMLTLIMA